MEHRQVREIPPDYHRAVRLAASLLLEVILHLAAGGEPDESIALDELPPNYRARIEKELYRWSVAFAVAGSKLAETRPEPVTCVAEQLAMHAILTFAVEILADGPAFGLPVEVARTRSEEWQDRIYDDLFDDTDFLFLYDPALDGIGEDPDEPIGSRLRTVNLAYEEWFCPLPGRLGHPYFDSGEPEAEDDALPWF